MLHQLLSALTPLTHLNLSSSHLIPLLSITLYPNPPPITTMYLLILRLSVTMCPPTPQLSGSPLPLTPTLVPANCVRYV